MTRKRVKQRVPPQYPSLLPAGRRRNRLLEIAGAGILSVSVLGLAACGQEGGRTPVKDLQAGEDVQVIADVVTTSDSLLPGDDVQAVADVVDVRAVENVDVSPTPDIPNYWEEEWTVAGG